MSLQKSFLFFISLTLVLTALSACSDPEAVTPDTGFADDVADDVTHTNDTSHDASDSGDISDTGDSTCPSPPQPALGDTPTAQIWRSDASRCGQPSFTVVEDHSLGDVLALGYENTYEAGTLQALANSQGLVLPRDLSYDSRVRVFSYMTQDRGELVEATALLAHPISDDPNFEPGAPILFLHGTTGFTDECAPSAAFETQLLSAAFASMGYTIVAPDFIGLKSMGEPTGFLHPYLVGQPTAIASMDSLRAFYKLDPDERGGHCYPHEFVSFGGSQGGHAALWVDRLATTYAPEFEHLGAVATVPPADIRTQVERALLEPINATGNSIAFFGTVASWYGAEENLDEIFRPPFDEDVPAVLGGGCSFGEITGEFEELDDLFTDELLESVADGHGIPDPWGCMIDDSGLLTTETERYGPYLDSYGIYFVLGEADDLVHTPTERESFVTLCEQGMPLAYLECADGPHGATNGWALPEMLNFIDDRRARVPFDATGECVVDQPVVCEGTPEP